MANIAREASGSADMPSEKGDVSWLIAFLLIAFLRIAFLRIVLPRGPGLLR